MKQALFFLFLSLSGLLCRGASGAPGFFYDHLKHDYDVPYASSAGQVSRLKMVREIGRKHPNLDCSRDCASPDPAVRRTCGMGSLGSLYVLTERQWTTKRTDLFIWRGPNMSLTVEPYAYMKEMEAGIPCEESGFIRKFPTRRGPPGSLEPPIDRVEVCRDWRNYFCAARSGGRASGVSRQRHAQKLLWLAHTASLLHAYWQYYPEFVSIARQEVPAREYEMWMGWNLIVGAAVPYLNPRSCGSDSHFLMTQLMPPCIRGTRLPDGRICTGANPPRLDEALVRWGFALAQNILANRDFGRALRAMEATVRQERASLGDVDLCR